MQTWLSRTVLWLIVQFALVGAFILQTSFDKRTRVLLYAHDVLAKQPRPTIGQGYCHNAPAKIGIIFYIAKFLSSECRENLFLLCWVALKFAYRSNFAHDYLQINYMACVFLSMEVSLPLTYWPIYLNSLSSMQPSILYCSPSISACQHWWKWP